MPKCFCCGNEMQVVEGNDGYVALQCEECLITFGMDVVHHANGKAITYEHQYFNYEVLEESYNQWVARFKE